MMPSLGEEWGDRANKVAEASIDVGLQPDR